MNIHISFNTNGTAQCLWTEALPLHELGRLEITRATNIEFNNTTQQWAVIDRKGKVRFIARSRAACLEWEHENLQPDQEKACLRGVRSKRNGAWLLGYKSEECATRGGSHNELLVKISQIEDWRIRNVDPIRGLQIPGLL